MPGHALAVVMLVLGAAGAVMAAPVVPAHDDEVVEQLPGRTDAAARRQRAALRQQPRQLQVALAAAQAALQRARRDGDPRELGAAQAALAPWWDLPEPPAAVRLLRGLVLQAGHRFEPARADLVRLADDDRAPLALQAQALLSLAGVLQVGGRLDDAGVACARLLLPRFAPLGAAVSTPAQACQAELRSLQADPTAAAGELDQLLRRNPDDRWLALLRAELAWRQDDHAAAEAAFGTATRGDAGVYAVAAHADWLLDRNRPQQALDLLRARGGDADALLLLEAIAERRLGGARAAELRARLAARFDAARRRGDDLHAREEARFALDLADDPPQAMALARRNWTTQREPSDAWLLARAAVAAGDRAALQLLHQLLPDPARADRRLARLLTGARA